MKIAKASTAGNFYLDVLLFSDSVNVFVDKWVKSGSEAVQKLLEVVPEHEDWQYCSCNQDVKTCEDRTKKTAKIIDIF